MHMQLRLKIATATTEGTGAMSAREAQRDPVELRRGVLLDVLRRIADAGVNLRIAGGSWIEGPGELILAVEDEDAEALESALRGYHFHRQEVEFEELEDVPGALAGFVEKLTNQGRMVNEIFVGSAHDGRVPVQISTVIAANDQG